MKNNVWPKFVATAEKITLINQIFVKRPRLTSIHRKCLSYNSIQQKSLSYNSIHQSMEKTIFHTFFIHFRKTKQKKLNHFCGFLKTIEQTGDKKKPN